MIKISKLETDFWLIQGIIVKIMDEDILKKKNYKLIIGIAVILAALVYFVISTTISQSRYFMTVEEMLNRKAELVDRSVRISGVVLGDTIVYDPLELQLSFTVAQIPGDHRQIKEMGGMAFVLNQAANDPSLPRLQIVYEGARPDLLQHEAQAIMTGALGADGVFHASELLLKCPSKYEAQLPDQSE